MKKIFKSFHGVVILVIVISLMAVPAAVLADWDEGDCYKMHYPQLPDLTGNGMNIFSGGPSSIHLPSSNASM